MKSSASVNPQREINTPEVWLEQHGNLLYKYAFLRVRDANVAEDLVQETLVKAIDKLGSFRGEASIRTWLFAILRNEISNFFRVKKREKCKISDSGSDSTIPIDQLLSPRLAGEEFSTSLERDEFWDAVQDCFKKVPEHLLSTFLYRLTNPAEKIDDLCEMLGIKPSNFSVRIFRTRLMLRECLERSWMSEE
jgi:RNA polymerase sigma-70 factor (ECF subfamily)